MKLAKEELADCHDKKEISFTWNPGSDEFSIDDNRLSLILGITSSISSVQDFFGIFSDSNKALLFNLFENVVEGKEPDPIKICLVNRVSGISLDLISVKKITENLVAGAMTPLVLSPTHEDVSSFFYQIFENCHHGIILADEETRIIACNTYYEQSLGYKVDELIGRKTSVFNAGKHGQVYYHDMWEKLDKQGYWSGLILSKGKSGNIKPQELLIQRLVSVSKHIYYFGMTYDLSDKLYRVAGIEHGGIELLTQLPGEDEFFSKIQDLVSDLKEEQGMLVLSFVPLFDKQDEFEYKKQLASALAYYERECAAGFIKKSVFTIAIIYQCSADKPHAMSIYEAIRTRFNEIKRRVSADVYRHIMDCTIGVSVLGLDANNENKLISHSLQAMYERHTQNNNNICFFNRTLHENVERREVLEEIVSNSIEFKTLEVFFQPVICTSQWRVCKFEALCRFKDYNGDLLNTQEMISIAEDMGLISELDLVMADKAIGYRDVLVEMFGENVELAINISLNFEKPLKSFFTDLLQVFKRHTRHLPYITIELTEPAYLDCQIRAKESDLLFDLRDKGLKIAIDDFGTVSCLKNGHFDLLKIDREVVKDLTKDSDNYHIAKMVTQLAHTMNIEVVAEGVENKQEADALNDLNVDYMQGFYFERPLPINALSVDIDTKGENPVPASNLFKPEREDVDLIVYPPVLSPEQTLEAAKALFDNHPFSTLPVILDRYCVGIITREIFNLYSTPSLGTDRETMQDYRSLTKVVSSMMESSITKVSETLSTDEMSEKVKQGHRFPWVVVNDAGKYVGIIDTMSMVHYLNEQLVASC
ncbi:EAL domain-containing protein [Vibrio salinus]|uniref:EAL domain-containing protein n=1 Tax=Vibrio salinus TaxID=2899784 RepID=UPI001E449EBE|nr:EAL domain-containing protein [Vibrio salinus]MCE0494639.1 EAL domain-containing protein [Vibrio salinus]